jgi:hypothetical protein
MKGLHIMPKKNLVRYSEARREIGDADVLLFRARGLLWRAVAVAGRSEYTHAAMAGWWNRRLMCVEMTSGGGRAQLLSNIVEQWPGVIDVYALKESQLLFSRSRAIHAMIAITGKDYGWWNLLAASLYHLPVFRFLVPPDPEDTETTDWPPFCSQAVSLAMRAGGLDPVPQLADRLTEPGDLARSAILEYRSTLL